MKPTYSTIDSYIDSFEGQYRNKLQELRKIINQVAPIGTLETISYAMPTFKWKGNLIHFAQAKNHIGIYPGSKAIEALSAKLAPYKTTKGAIQIPLDVELPRQLIEDLVKFNMDLLKDKTGPQWDKYNAEWKDCARIMQRIVQKTTLTKEFKWGSDVYTYQSKNCIGWRGFKDFFSLWFYNGVFLADKYKVLINANEGNTKSLRQWRFTSAKEMDEQKILEYVNESIQTIADGKVLKAVKDQAPLIIDGLLQECLSKDTFLNDAFSKLWRSNYYGNKQILKTILS